VAGKEPSSIMATIMSLCSLIDPRSRVVIQEDAADNHVLACAKDSRANFVASGNPHLLKLGEYEKTKKSFDCNQLS
jgi:predicted nucleic acid-binding protein